MQINSVNVQSLFYHSTFGGAHQHFGVFLSLFPAIAPTIAPSYCSEARKFVITASKRNKYYSQLNLS